MGLLSFLSRKETRPAAEEGQVLFAQPYNLTIPSLPPIQGNAQHSNIASPLQQLSLELQEDIKNKAAKDRSSVLRATTSVIASSWKIPAAEKKLKELNELQKSLFKQLLIHIRYI